MDHRLAGEITCGTSRNTVFYKVFVVIAYHYKNVCFITFFFINVFCCFMFLFRGTDGDRSKK